MRSSGVRATASKLLSRAERSTNQRIVNDSTSSITFSAIWPTLIRDASTVVVVVVEDSGGMVADEEATEETRGNAVEVWIGRPLARISADRAAEQRTTTSSKVDQTGVLAIRKHRRGRS